MKAYRKIRDCKYVINVHDILITKNKIVIIMEYCNGGSLERKMWRLFKGN